MNRSTARLGWLIQSKNSTGLVITEWISPLVYLCVSPWPSAWGGLPALKFSTQPGKRETMQPNGLLTRKCNCNDCRKPPVHAKFWGTCEPIQATSRSLPPAALFIAD